MLLFFFQFAIVNFFSSLISVVSASPFFPFSSSHTSFLFYLLVFTLFYFLKVFPSYSFSTFLEIRYRIISIFPDYNSWWPHFKTFTQENTNFSTWKNLVNPEDFSMVFSDFMFSSSGSKFKINFQFDGELECNSPAPSILVFLQLYNNHIHSVYFRLPSLT